MKRKQKHPNSMPPSLADFYSCFIHNYAGCIVVCHNGTVYNYMSNQEVPEKIHDMYVKKFICFTHNEVEAQLMALDKIKRAYDISYQEVK